MRAQEIGRKEITKEDIEYVKRLFLSVRESVQYVKEYENYFLR